MNIPTRAGDRYTCFILIRPDRTDAGPYGSRDRWPLWECEDCGFRLSATYTTSQGLRRWSAYDMKRMADHHECGHAPCEKCGKLLLRRRDGSPRQHAHHLCPGKDPGFKIEREFVRHMSTREYA